ncbi:MAG: NADH:ubiquinone oxidoreductase [Spirochaetaceae bacterium]|nr:MAG: NADH:ubiquinone oxidoreductase [Spirochaetaceae bacterium]
MVILMVMRVSQTVVLLAFAAVVASPVIASGPSSVTVIDDFRDSHGTAVIGTRWESFTDRVMGGRSDMSAGIVRDDGRNVLRMSGRVSLENNGGFIQVRLPLAASGTLDAGAYDGVILEVRTGAGEYSIHLRDDRTRLPWAYYRHSIDAGDDWTVVRLPFREFDSEGMLVSRAPNAGRLRSIAVVATGDNAAALIEVRSIGLYRHDS